MNCVVSFIVVSLLLGGNAAMAQTVAKTLDGQTFAAEAIYRDSFEELSDLWIADGKAKVSVAGRKLVVDATGEGDAQCASIWLNRELSGDVLIEYTATCPPQESEVANLNQFLMATETGGADILSKPHSGNYREYHSLPLYIITLTHKWSRLRKCPEFRCVSERMDVHSENDRVYAVQILKTGKRIRYFINGEKIHDWTDEEGDPAHMVGKFGLRVWHTLVHYWDFGAWQVSATTQ